MCVIVNIYFTVHNKMKTLNTSNKIKECYNQIYFQVKMKC